MVALVLSAWHRAEAQQITDAPPSSPDIPGFTIPLSLFFSFLLLFFLQGVSLPVKMKKKIYIYIYIHIYTQMLNRDPSTVPHIQ